MQGFGIRSDISIIVAISQVLHYLDVDKAKVNFDAPIYPARPFLLFGI